MKNGNKLLPADVSNSNRPKGKFRLDGLEKFGLEISKFYHFSPFDQFVLLITMIYFIGKVDICLGHSYSMKCDENGLINNF